MDAASARKELVRIGRKIEAKGLVVGPGGNISMRVGSLVYVKASGVEFENAAEDDYVGVDLETGELVDGKKKPTSEILMHRGCYKARPDAQAVVHTHPPFAVGVANAGRRLEPSSPDFVALLGREVPLLPYVVPTGQEIADAVVEGIREHNVLLLANHGVVAVGASLEEAYYRNLLVEAAAISLVAGCAVGEPRSLSDEEVTEIDNLGAEKYRRKMLKRRE